MWLRPVRLEDAEQTQELFPQWEIVKYLGAVVPWPYPPEGSLTFHSQVANPQMERGAYSAKKAGSCHGRLNI